MRGLNRRRRAEGVLFMTAVGALIPMRRQTMPDGLDKPNVLILTVADIVIFCLRHKYAKEAPLLLEEFG